MFVIIEVAPILFKMMLVKSSYDWMQENVAQILEAKQGISLREITDENNNMHRYRENYNAMRIAEVAKHQNDLEKENAQHAMSLYAAKEKEEIEKDPNKFITND
jgi:predicted transcriptional regulator